MSGGGGATCEATTLRGNPCCDAACFAAKGTIAPVAYCAVHKDLPECSFCLSTLHVSKKRTLPCGHAFHRGCLAPWLSREMVCPTCRCSAYPPLPPEVPEPLELVEMGWLERLWLWTCCVF